MKILILCLIGIFASVKGHYGESFFAYCSLPNNKGHLSFQEHDGAVTAEIMLRSLDPCSNVTIQIHENAPATPGTCENVGGHFNIGHNNVVEGDMKTHRSSSNGEVHLHSVNLHNKLSLSYQDPDKMSIIGKAVGVHQSDTMMCCKIVSIDEEKYNSMAHDEEEDEPVDEC